SNSYNYMTARIFIDTDATPVVRESIDSGATWSPDNRLWGTANTTVDGSGFLLEASPVLRVHAAHLEEPVKPVGAGLRHADTGHYVLTGTPPLAATGWRVRCPQDENGAPVARVADLYRHDGALHLRVCDPAGMPSDIPAGHFIMLRFRDAATEDDTPPPITELTAAEVTAREAALRETAVKAACRRRILDVLPETAQINLAAAVAAGRLSDADLSVYQAGLAWVDDMRAT
ncbi:hypothetical protein, partial [Roseovarius sp. SYSU LYC5161]|uniref:phage tail fiber protein n=1 Tax=Roseovarius halophilus (ex Wu et al. 2025) TaxID=3376060 RepID=UPI003999CCF0